MKANNEVHAIEGLKTYEKLRRILPSGADYSRCFIDQSNAGTNQRKKLIYRDFVRIYRGMLSCIHDCGDKWNCSNCATIEYCTKVIELFYNSLVFNTEKVSTLRDTFRKIRTGDNFPQYFVEYLMKNLISNYNCKPDEFVETSSLMATWAHFFNLPQDTVLDFLKSSRFTQIDYSNILYCLSFKAFFITVLADSFIIISEEDTFRGDAGLVRYFDGFIELSEYNTSKELYLFKSSSLAKTAISTITDFCNELEDISGSINTSVGGIVFVPDYPTPATLKTELYWKNERKIDLLVLYLADYYELFRIWVKDHIKRFMAERLR